MGEGSRVLWVRDTSSPCTYVRRCLQAHGTPSSEGTEHHKCGLWRGTHRVLDNGEEGRGGKGRKAISGGLGRRWE